MRHPSWESSEQQGNCPKVRHASVGDELIVDGESLGWIFICASTIRSELGSVTLLGSGFRVLATNNRVNHRAR